MKYHRLGSSNNKPLFLTVLEVRSPRSEEQNNRILGEGLLRGFHVAIFSSYPYLAKRDKRKQALGVLVSGLIPFMRAPLSGPNHPTPS